jgi:hypothetical protein
VELFHYGFLLLLLLLLLLLPAQRLSLLLWPERENS